MNKIHAWLHNNWEYIDTDCCRNILKSYIDTYQTRLQTWNNLIQNAELTS